MKSHFSTGQLAPVFAAHACDTVNTLATTTTFAMAPQSKDSLTVIDNRNGKSYTIPISVTAQDSSIPASAFKDIVHERENGAKQGLRVTDRGFLNTAVIQSHITFIDGDEGILRYRGYPIEQLAEKSTFLETAYLLIWGELPSKKKYDTFHDEVMHHSTMHVDAEEIFRSFRYGTLILSYK